MLTIHEACEQAYKRGLEDGRKEGAEALRTAEVVAKHHWDLYCQALADGMAWIPVTERLPTEEGSYLVCTDRGSVYTKHFYPKKRFSSGYVREAKWSGKGNVRTTHWRSFPQPPKGEQTWENRECAE